MLLKPSELALQPADFNKQSLNVALSYRERLCGFLLSNDFPLYLPHATGVEIEVSSFSLCLTHLHFVSNTRELEPAEATAVPVTHLQGCWCQRWFAHVDVPQDALGRDSGLLQSHMKWMQAHSWWQHQHYQLPSPLSLKRKVATAASAQCPGPGWSRVPWEHAVTPMNTQEGSYVWQQWDAHAIQCKLCILHKIKGFCTW